MAEVRARLALEKPKPVDNLDNHRQEIPVVDTILDLPIRNFFGTRFGTGVYEGKSRVRCSCRNGVGARVQRERSIKYYPVLLRACLTL